jgi:hypothetical protein
MTSPSQTDWTTLRRILMGQPVASNELTPTVGKAAMLGGVVHLAVAGAPELQPLLTQAMEERVFSDMLLAQAESHVAEVMTAASTGTALLLKGSASSQMIYTESVFRERRDLDLLIPDPAFQDAVNALMDAGWETTEGPWWLKRKASQYEVPLKRQFANVSVECDLHRRLSLTRHLPIDIDALCARATPIAASPFLLPSRIDLILHTVLHAANTGFTVPVKSWWDLHLLLEENDLAPDALIARAQEWEISHSLWAALTIVQNLFPKYRDMRWMADIAPKPPIRGWLRTILSGKGETPLHSAWPREQARLAAKAMVFSGQRPIQWVMELMRLRMGLS